MSEPPAGASTADQRPHSPLELRALAAVIALEGVALAVLSVVLVFDVFTATADSLLSAVALTVITLIGAVWLIVMAVHTLRGNSWIRAAAVTVQVLVIAVAIGSFQGIFARPDVGWLLLVPATVVLVLLFTPAVVAATRRT